MSPFQKEIAMTVFGETLLHAGSASRQIHIPADIFHRITQHSGCGAVDRNPAMLIHGEFVVARPAARFQHKIRLFRIERHRNVGALLNDVLH